MNNNFLDMAACKKLHEMGIVLPHEFFWAEIPVKIDGMKNTLLESRFDITHKSKWDYSTHLSKWNNILRKYPAYEKKQVMDLINELNQFLT